SIVSPGLHVKLPWKAVPVMDWHNIGSDSPSKGMLTKDKKNLDANAVTRWRISEPPTFYKHVRKKTPDKNHVVDIILSELRRELGKENFGDILGNVREPLMKRVAETARTRVSEFGIDIVDVGIKRADLPQEVQVSVFERMKAERERVAKKYRSEGG